MVFFSLIFFQSGENRTPKLARRPVHSSGIIVNNNNQAARLPQVGKETKTESAALLAGQVALMTLGEEHAGGGTLPSINTNPSSTKSSPIAVSAMP